MNNTMTRPAQRRSDSAFALLMVLIYAGAALMVLCGVLGWSTSKVRLGGRQNQMHGAVGAAEAATEKVLSRMAEDFQKYGGPALDTNLSVYTTLVPNLSESSLLANYTYTDTNGAPNRISITKLMSWQYTNLESTFAGLQGFAVKYSLVSQAKDISSSTPVSSAVEQDVEFVSLPVFQFNVFYGMDMEICPGSNLKFTGRVHGNSNVYLYPGQSTLTFQGPVTAGQQVLQQQNPLDPVSRTFGSVVFQSDSRSRVKTLNPPLGTNVGPDLLRQLVGIPPTGESLTSQLGQQRFYNKADMLIFVTDTNTVVTTSGSYNSFSTVIPWANIQPFFNTNLNFYDMREGQWILVSQLDVNAFNGQYATLTALLGRAPKTVYINDFRTNWWNEAAIRLINGQTLPSQGLTVATPNPVYIQGHYNAPAAYLGTTNTTLTVPASVVADAITVLSGNWRDNRSWWSLSSRPASSTTINAALIGGIVPSDGNYYSGGVENMVRLLENWSGRVFTFNGSMVVLYQSQIATAPWGATSQVYNPPTRNWSFDPNFLNGNKLPPSTPELRTILRTQWATLVPN